MHCHGQCLLSQEMAHADNNNSDSPLLPKINFEDYPIAVLDHPFRSDTQPFEAGINSTDYLSSIVSLYYSEILKPPC